MECSSSDEEKHLEMSENSENIYVNLDTNENNTDTAAAPIAVENPSYNNTQNDSSDPNSDVPDYTSPNNVESDANKKPQEESVTVQMAEVSDDPEVHLAKAIIEGNLEAVKNSMKTIKEKDSN